MFEEEDEWKKIVDKNGDFITPFCEDIDPIEDANIHSRSGDGAVQDAILTDQPCDLPSALSSTYLTHPGTRLADPNILDVCLVSFDGEEAKGMSADAVAGAVEHALSHGNRAESQADVSWFRRLHFGKMVGCGSHGQVYEVDLDGETYAAKILRACTRQEVKQIASEAQLNLRFSHENIVTTYKCLAISQDKIDVCSELWILQELCKGGSLHKALENHVFDVDNKEELVCKIAMEIARGIEYLHSQDIIHGDLSSNNLLLQKIETDGQGYNVIAKINDFGRAKYRQGLKSMKTNTLGTVTYMPPEMLMDGSLKPSLDIYSLGILLAEIWTGQNPWGAANFAQIIFAVSQGKTPSVPDDIPNFLKEIIGKCMSGSATERPTASEIVRYFEARQLDR